MNVLVVEPGYAPYEKKINGLEEMQQTVGGLITISYPYKEPVAIVSNDESILLGMDFNRSIPGGYGGIQSANACYTSETIPGNNILLMSPLQSYTGT